MTQQTPEVSPEGEAWDAGKQTVEAASGVEDADLMPEPDLEDEQSQDQD